MNAVAYFHRDVEENRNLFKSVVGGFVRGIEASASVDLRNKIDLTLSALSARVEMYSEWAKSGNGLAEMLRNCEVVPGEFVDRDLELEDAGLGAISRIIRDRKRLRVAQVAVVNDKRLCAEDCRKLSDAYRACIAATVNAEKALESLMAAIDFHDEAAVAEDERKLTGTAEILQFVYGERAKQKLEVYGKLCSSEQFSYDEVAKRSVDGLDSAE